MRLHLAARMHAYVHGLFRPKDEAETRLLWQKVERAYSEHDLDDSDVRDELITRMAATVLRSCDLDVQDQLAPHVVKLITRLFDYEQLLALPQIDWTAKRSVSEWWALRDLLLAEAKHFEDFDETLALIEDQLLLILEPVLSAAPKSQKHAQADGTLTVPVKLLQGTQQAAEVTERILLSVLPPESEAWRLFPRLAVQLQHNLAMASARNPLEPVAAIRSYTLPTRSTGKTPDAIVETYVGRTPLQELLQLDTTLTIPDWVRFEHCHIVGGSGHGKSQTLQYMVCEDLAAVAAGERSIIVLDSQGDLIRNIASLAEFGPGGALHDRIVLIDPSDVEWPVSLNLFDVGIERLSGYEPLERERLTNSILELYDFVLGSLLSAEMTQKQNVIFRYVTRLMLHIPDATIHTLRELMEPGAEKTFAPYIAKLPETARRFFETEFTSREFDQTKKQVLRRLWGILENQTFERMFSHPRSKLDLFSEMNAGKVILINTAKDLLKEQGSEIFGRFFIALIAQAAQERATLPEKKRLPTYVYIDEAADYFDRNIGTILAQARKYNVGMVLAHQYLGQLDGRLQEAFAANTSIKFAGGVSAKDARSLAPMLQASPEMIEAQPKGTFAAFIRGVTASSVSLRFPMGYLEARPRMTASDKSALRTLMRERYAVHFSSLTQNAAEPEPEEIVEPEAKKPQTSIKPSEEPKPPGSVDITPGSDW